MYKLTTLKNKLKVVTHHIPGAHGVTSGIFVSTGSRYESNSIAGISHFAEHMFFKGTTKRPTPAEVSRAIEGIGGYTNAATSQDYTFFYNRVPKRHAETSLEILSDMINNSLFEKDAISRERGVILEELNMYLDTPTRYIYDLIMQSLWPSSPLGRDVIGAKAAIKAMDQKKFLNYIQSQYQPKNMVVSLAGRVDHNKTVRMVKKYFGDNRNGKLIGFKKASPRAKQNILIHTKATDQAHLCLAMPIFGRGNKYDSELAVLNTILGTGMSSRLFLNIREKRGLCYYVSSFTEKFAETGLLGITAGLNTGKVDLAIKAILSEIDSLAKIEVTKEELDRAKEYLRGTLALSMDNTDNMAIYYGSQALFFPHIESVEDKISKLLKVTERDIIKVAQKLFDRNKLSLAIIGPFKQTQKNYFYKLLK